MEQRTNKDDQLNELLRTEAENHEMYPSEMVWENIRTTIHGNKSWPALTVIATLIIVALSIITFYNYPPTNITDKKLIIATSVPSNSNQSNTELLSAKKTEEYAAQINPEHLTAQTIEAVNTNLLAEVTTSTSNKENTFTNLEKPIMISSEKTDLKNHTVEITSLIKPSLISLATTTENNAIAIQKEIEENIPENISAKNKLSFTGKENDEDPNASNFTNEFGNQTINQKRNKSRWGWQLYATPSTSYRKLEDETPFSLSNLFSGVDKSVQHKPALGIEFGTAVTYAITKNLRLTTGLQFNIRQYHMDAYKSYGLATIAFVQNNRLDSVRLFTLYSNNNVTNNSALSTKLDNKLYQVSIPIGLEWDVVQGKKLGLRVGASIQPTFTLNKSIYMISSDYKYYADGASFFRKWNYNSNLELNFTYKTKNTTWFIGPQMRYQHLPTYTDQYSIKEHRIDYGLKIGFTKPF